MFWQFFALDSCMFSIQNWDLLIFFKLAPFIALFCPQKCVLILHQRIFWSKLSFHLPPLIIHISLWLMWKFIGHVECWQIVLTVVNQFQSRTRGIFYILFVYVFQTLQWKVAACALIEIILIIVNLQIS